MTNLKPFDLAKALAGDSVITRDGRKVLQLFNFDKSQEVDSLCVVIENLASIVSYLPTGSFNRHHPTELDLFMAPKKKKLWIGINKNSDGGFSAYHLTTGAYGDINKVDKIFDNMQIVEVEIDDE